MKVTAALVTGLALLVLPQTAGAQENPALANPASLRVRYVVDDVAATVAFYTTKLGFKVDLQSPPYFAALSRGGIQLLISPTKGIGGASQPMPDGRRPVPGGWNRIVLYTPD